MKIFILIFLCWSKLVIYNPIISKTTTEWKENDSIPPRFSERTKQLMKKQKWAKIWTIILSIIPLGPISMIATILLLHGPYSKGTLIKDELKKQSDNVENFKEELRKSKQRFLDIVEKGINKDRKFDWRQVVLPGSPEDIKIRDLMLQLESMGIFNTPPKDPKYKKKYEEYLESKEKENMEIPLLDNDLAYEAYGITPDGDADDLELDFTEEGVGDGDTGSDDSLGIPEEDFYEDSYEDDSDTETGEHDN